jgi:hypothetical protein
MKNFLISCVFIFAFGSANAYVSNLAISSQSRYYCLNSTTIDNSVKTIFKKHFYHSSKETPKVIPYSENNSTYCHDVLIYGAQDDPFYPRLGHEAIAFNLFDKYAPNFQDYNLNGRPDLEDYIKSSYWESTGTLPPNDKIFSQLKYKSSPVSRKENLGYIVKPRVVSALESACPTTNSSTEFQRYIAQSLGNTNLEPIYVAKEVGPQQSESNTQLLSVSELKGVWFYVTNTGARAEPSSKFDMTRTLFFFWPIDRNSPFIKKSHQQTYRIVSAKNANLQLDYKIKTPDNSIGCIPKAKNYIQSSEGLGTGEKCYSHLSCSSLNCNMIYGKCEPREFAAIPSGGTCLAEFSCMDYSVSRSKLTFHGRDLSGQPICQERIYTSMQRGSCENFTCIPPLYDLDLPADLECIRKKY